jgi:predicted CxxxxCH...CXXCH cytochrome family protein
MSTPCYIGRDNGDGTYTAVYCHSDGYPEGVGTMLLAHYATWDRVAALLALGNLSVLNERIGSKQDFGSYRWEMGTCLAYGRDRGETGQQAQVYRSLAHLGRIADGDPVYIARADAGGVRWWMLGVAGLVQLRDVLADSI